MSAGDPTTQRRAATRAHRLRERVNLSVSGTEFEELKADWLAARTPAELRGLALDELAVAARLGLDLGPGAIEDLEDLSISAETLRRMPVAGYEALLDAFGDARRRDADKDDVVRRWHAAYGGFLVLRDGAPVLHLPIGKGDWALCDGRRLWRVEGNPFGCR